MLPSGSDLQSKLSRRIMSKANEGTLIHLKPELIEADENTRFGRSEEHTSELQSP